MAEDLEIIHLIFVDDILLFNDGSRWDMVVIIAILQLFQKATDMQVNITKTTISPITLFDAKMDNINSNIIQLI